MKTEILSTRLDYDTKIIFGQICDAVGLSSSQAVKLFAKAVINHGGIPFELKAVQPNALTLQAMQELEQGSGTQADDVNQLFEALSDGQINHVPA